MARWLIILALVFFALYVFAKVRSYMRQSDEEWKQVDKTKLKKWQDDDDWK